VAGRLFGVELLDAAIAELEHEAIYYERHGGAALRDAFLDEIEADRASHRRESSVVSGVAGQARRASRCSSTSFAIGFVIGSSKDESPLIVVIAHAKRRPARGDLRHAAREHGPAGRPF